MTISLSTSARPEALFINGVFEGVLEDICAIQHLLPEQIMFLQPYKSSAMTKLRDDPPTVDRPMLVAMSTTDDLDTVHYAGEIVGWEDKTQMPRDKWRLLNRLVAMLQPTEEGLYDASRVPEKQSINLLFVRRMRRIAPMPVTSLRNTKDDEPLAGGRSTAGGWIYVSPSEIAAAVAAD